jgi:hypothetical protein
MIENVRHSKVFFDSEAQRDPEYIRYLDALERSGGMSPMSEDCRVVVNIPAWMEGANIYDLLEEYYQQEDSNGQPLPPELYEINIIVNRKTGSEPDNSVEEKSVSFKTTLLARAHLRR